MLRRLFGLVLLLAFIAAGLYLWKARPGSLGGVGRDIEDAKTTASVKAALALSRSLRPLAITPSTEDGVVTLRGGAPSEDLRSQAERTTAAVPGVRQVVNHVAIEAGPAEASPGSAERSIGESLDDQALEVQVRMALSLNRDLEGADVHVRSFRREVTLSGLVDTPEQERVAVAVARETAQVAGVTDELRVRSANGPGSGGPDRIGAVRRALARDPQLSAYRIAVKEHRGRPVLEGRVHTGAEKELAGLLARDAFGDTIENALVVRP